MAVSKRTRYEVLRRDNHTCRYCGASAPDVPLRVDHVTPVALGGTDDPSNLVAACQDCNAGKASTSPDAAVVTDVAQDAIRWSAAFRRAAENRSLAEKPRSDYVLRFNTKWTSWHFLDGTFPRDNSWRRSIEKFHDIGVPIEELERLIDLACGSERIPADDAWRYFCGCVWRYVTEVREAAEALLAKENADGA